jgi:hypothetical protein
VSTLDTVPPDPDRLSQALAAYLEALDALELAEEELEHVAGVEGAGSSAAEGGPVIFLTSDGLVWYPTAFARCVAPTKRGPRCRNPVFDGQVWVWRGPFAVLDDEWNGRMLSQTCATHDDGRTDYEPPEWVRIAIDDRLLRRLPD